MTLHAIQYIIRNGTSKRLIALNGKRIDGRICSINALESLFLVRQLQAFVFYPSRRGLSSCGGMRPLERNSSAAAMSRSPNFKISQMNTWSVSSVS